MFPRIIGTETEYGWDARLGNRVVFQIMNASHGPRFFRDFVHPSIRPARFLFPAAGTTRVFLLNGACWYQDTGFHPEYASPEGLGPREAALYEVAGGRIVEDIVKRANQELASEGIVVRSFKHNLDSRALHLRDAAHWPSFGHHENYLITRKCPLGEFDLLLGPAFASLPIISGNGWLCLDEGRMAYLVSQRALLTVNMFSVASTGVRPLFNTRDEPHADEKKYRRMHLIASDSLSGELALYLSLAIKDILFDAVEEGYLNRERLPCGTWSQNEILEALHVFGRDSSLSANIEIGGRVHTAISVQEAYRDLARKFCEVSGHLDEERKEVFDEWDFLLERAKSPRPHEALMYLGNWAAKKYVLEQKLEKEGFDWSASPNAQVTTKSGNPTLFNLLKNAEMLFDEQSPGSISRRLIREGLIKKIFPEEEIEAVQWMPKPTCRSFARASQLRWLHEYAVRKNIIINFSFCDWTRILAKDEAESVVIYNRSDHDPSSSCSAMLDPFDPNPRLPSTPAFWR